jgi:hypothetical protein
VIIIVVKDSDHESLFGIFNHQKGNYRTDMQTKPKRDQEDKGEVKALSGKESNRDSRSAATAQKGITAIHHCG